MAVGRGAESTANSTAATQNQGYYTNAQNSYTQAQGEEGNYEKQLGAYSSANPYGAGGAFQTATNQQLTNTADASAKALGTTLEGQALRTGQNTSGGVAAAEQESEANERTLGGQEAAATQTRIGDEAGYNQSVLSATAQPVGAETALSGQQGQLAGGALGEQVKAGETPSWTDEFGNSVAKGLGQLVTTGAKG